MRRPRLVSFRYNSFLYNLCHLVQVCRVDSTKVVFSVFLFSSVSIRVLSMLTLYFGIVILGSVVVGRRNLVSTQHGLLGMCHSAGQEHHLFFVF